MRKRLILVGVGVVMAICLGAAAGASAATEIGDPCIANLNSPQPAELAAFQFAAPLSPLPMAAPSSGVITSWGLNVGSALEPGASSSVKFKVLRPNVGSKTVQVVGEGSGTAVTGANTFQVRIPVQAGDRVGVAVDGTSILACEESPPGDVLAFIEGDPATGSTVPFIESAEVKGQIALFATVEPDADGDGYGDETQDKCPTDASTHEACPPPPATTQPPITLSDSAAAKKTFLTVSLTTTAQATVTVTGTVKIGKGKTVKLKGNTQTVALGALAKFTVLFPAKLKAALKKLPIGKKLTINLSASAPGATTKVLTVKVPGQMKPQKKHVK